MAALARVVAVALIILAVLGVVAGIVMLMSGGRGPDVGAHRLTGLIAVASGLTCLALGVIVGLVGEIADSLLRIEAARQAGHNPADAPLWQ